MDIGKEERKVRLEAGVRNENDTSIHFRAHFQISNFLPPEGYFVKYLASLPNEKVFRTSRTACFISFHFQILGFLRRFSSASIGGFIWNFRISSKGE